MQKIVGGFLMHILLKMLTLHYSSINVFVKFTAREGTATQFNITEVI
jgi:hypothetical protein